jgi:hypothetical protein
MRHGQFKEHNDFQLLPINNIYVNLQDKSLRVKAFAGIESEYEPNTN